MQICRALLAAFMVIAASHAPAHARILDWVGMFTDVNVEIGKTGFNKQSITAKVGESVQFYNESGRQLRVVASGVKLSTPLMPNGSSARMRFPRAGTFTLYCDKLCEGSLQVVIEEN